MACVEWLLFLKRDESQNKWTVLSGMNPVLNCKIQNFVKFPLGEFCTGKNLKGAGASVYMDTGLGFHSLDCNPRGRGPGLS